MYIDIIESAKAIDSRKIENSAVAIIDVLRATSVMLTAFANGAKSIIPVDSPAKAFALKKIYPEYLLGGEEDAIQVKGFDLDNSPFSYTREIVANKTIVMSTSNGTKAIEGSKNANRLVIASFLNANAIAQELKHEEKITLVCSGSSNSYTLEDALCAGYLVNLLQQHQPASKLSDLAISLSSLSSIHQNDIQNFASKGNHYQLLAQKGFQKDLTYCFKKNRYDLIPELNNGVIQII